MKDLDEIMRHVEDCIYDRPHEKSIAKMSDEIRADIQALIDASAVKWVPVSKGASRFGERALLTVQSLENKAVIIGTYDKEFGWDFDLSQLVDLGIDDGEVIAWAEMPKPWSED